MKAGLGRSLRAGVNRLWVKLTLAFLVVALVAVGLTAALSARATGEEFRQYVVGAGMAAQPAWAAALESYYAQHGTWDGVGSVLAQFSPGAGAGYGPGNGRGQAMGGANMGAGGPNLAVADASGRVVASRTGEMIGEQLPANVLAQGVLLHEPGGALVGTLLNVRPAQVVLDSQAQNFLNQVRTSAALSALAAVLLALVLGALISQRLAGPLVRLTHAAQGIAGGDLAQRVPLASADASSGDEIGQLSAAFNQMAAHLAEAETLRRNLVADVAHELRTPLTVIQGNLQAILDGIYPLDGEQIASLYDETRLLTRLVDDLRELALADAGQLRLERLPVNVTALAQAAVTNFGPAADAGGVHLSLNAASDTPEILGDADRLAQVLRNLIGNALRHTPRGGAITVRVCAERDEVVVTVADTGQGIAAADLPHVFDRFYRGDKSRSRAGGGAGLGLAIVRQLVTAHGGQINVESTLGAGAVFTVRLPVAPASPSTPSADSSTTRA
jgi:signal transduction histidine kinase